MDRDDLMRLLDDFRELRESHPRSELSTVHLAIMLEDSLGVEFDDSDLGPGSLATVADVEAALGRTRKRLH